MRVTPTKNLKTALKTWKTAKKSLILMNLIMTKLRTQIMRSWQQSQSLIWSHQAENTLAQEESDKEEASTEPVTGTETFYEATNDEGGMNSHPVSEQGTVEEMTDDSIISISIKEMSEKSKEFFTRAKELEDYIDNSSSSLEDF